MRIESFIEKYETLDDLRQRNISRFTQISSLRSNMYQNGIRKYISLLIFSRPFSGLPSVWRSGPFK